MSRHDALDLFKGRRLPVVIGAEAAECGLACMTMIARWHGHDVDLNGLRQRSGLSISGASLRTLMQMADRLGLASRALKVELGALQKVKTPAVLHWDLNHFVVLARAGAKTITIHDPAVGKRTLSVEEASRHFTGVVLELTPVDEFEKVEARRPVKLTSLWSRLEGFWSSLAQVLALSLALQVAVFAMPFFNQLVIDEAIARGDLDLLAVLAIGFGLLAVIQVGLTALRAYALQVIGQLMGFQMIGNLVRHLLRLTTGFYEKRHVGDILSRIQSTRPIQDALTRGAATVVIDGLMAVIALVILFFYSGLLTMIVVAALALSLIVTFAFYPITRRRSEEAIMAQAKEQTHLIESVRASRTLKLMGREPEREAAWRNLFAETVNANFSVARFEIIRNGLQGLITAIQTILVVYLAARMIINGAGFSVGMLFAFLSFRQTFTDRVLALINEAFNFRLLTLHLERISDIAHSEREPTPPSEPPEDATPPAGAISMSGIWFRYGEGDRFVLEDAALEVRAGEFLAITGASGGGKSTLLKLMLGLYDPTRGEISLDGRPPALTGWRAWRRHVGVVAQDDQLLSGTIADNIAFFDPDLDMARVQEAARAARVHEDIARMPMQYLSLIGDMGSALSGGQRQRVLLARALYRRPSILVLDEGTANLDQQTEAEIADAIEAMTITRIIVAHRPALVERADRVVRVEAGKVLDGPG
ncbi:MAG: peptidase domain-containing ABC transporter [Oceanicaulis sp.]